MNTCTHCGNFTSNPKFCSKSCSAKHNNKIPKRKITRKCKKCSNLVMNYKSYYCVDHYQTKIERQREFIENQTLASYYSKDSIKGRHASSKSVHIRMLARSWFRELTKLPCAKCGYDKHVEMCHIKAIKDFPDTALIKEVNCKDNIIQLCPNCHWELDNL